MEIILLLLVGATVVAIIANSKGRSGFGWFVFGVLLLLPAIILVIVLPSLTPAIQKVVYVNEAGQPLKMQPSVEPSVEVDPDPVIGLNFEGDDFADRFALVATAFFIVGVIAVIFNAL